MLDPKHTLIFTHVCVCLCTCVCVFKCTDTLTHAHAQTHTHTQTHTSSQCSENQSSSWVSFHASYQWEAAGWGPSSWWWQILHWWKKHLLWASCQYNGMPWHWEHLTPCHRYTCSSETAWGLSSWPSKIGTLETHIKHTFALLHHSSVVQCV